MNRAYAQRDTDGLWRVYDTACSGVISGPYQTEREAESYCEAVNDDNGEEVDS
jgi:hypothetical protein